MATLRSNPYRTMSFVVDIGDGEAAGFSEVILPDSGSEIVEYREGSDKDPNVRKLIGKPFVGNLVLKRGFTGSLDLYQWVKQSHQDPEQARRTVVLKLLSENGTDVVSTWKLRNAWPTRHSFSPFNAQDCHALIETLELACDSIEIE